LNHLRQIIPSLCQAIEQGLRQWTKPDNHSPIWNAALDLTRSKSELILENALLRQQLIILQRQTKRPKLTWKDRSLIVLLSSKLRMWKEALIIVQPDTVLRWHRELFKRFWKRKSKPKPKQGRPPLTDDLVTLIKRIVKENLTWGAERIRGELLKLGVRVNKSTIQKHMNEERKSRALKQTWATFLHNHASQIWACDFLQTYVMGSHTLNKSHRWDVTLSKAKSLDLRSESGFLTQNLRFFVASLLRMTMDAIYGLSKVLLPITFSPNI